MTDIILVSSQKGGTGKTMISSLVALACSRSDQTLLLEFDLLSPTLGYLANVETKLTSTTFFYEMQKNPEKDIPLQDLWKFPGSNLYILPADLSHSTQKDWSRFFRTPYSISDLGEVMISFLGWANSKKIKTIVIDLPTQLRPEFPSVMYATHMRATCSKRPLLLLVARPTSDNIIPLIDWTSETIDIILPRPYLAPKDAYPTFSEIGLVANKVKQEDSFIVTSQVSTPWNWISFIERMPELCNWKSFEQLQSLLDDPRFFPLLNRIETWQKR